MNWKLAGIALVIAGALWFTINVKNAESRPLAAEPSYGIEMDDGTVHRVPLMCHQMEEMLALTKDEGLKRQMNAMACGTDRQPKCLPYYVQWKVLGDLNNWLKMLIAENCKVH